MNRFPTFVLYIYMIVFSANALCQTRLPDAKDSITAIISDTTGLNKPLERHGRISLLNDDSYSIISKREITFTNYTSYFDILRERLPAYPLSLGNNGQFNYISLFSMKPADFSIKFNGRQLLDLAYSNYCLELIPPEFIENAEAYTGSDAAVLFSCSAGAGINFQEVKYDTKSSFTRLWYCQEGFDFIAADGIFSRNIYRNMNFAFGFRTMNSSGSIENSWLESWNLRGLLRWNFSKMTNLSLTENFNNYGLGTNGGIDEKASPDIFDDLTSQPLYSGLNERVFRHDITLSLSSYFTADSSNAASASIFYTGAEHNENYEPGILLNPEDTTYFEIYHERQAGYSVKIESKPLPFFYIASGSEGEFRKLDSNQYQRGTDDFSGSVYIYGKLNYGGFDLSGGFRTEQTGKSIAYSFGAKAMYKFKDSSRFFFDFSRTERNPSPVEMKNASKQTAFLALANISMSFSGFALEAGAFARKVNSPIMNKTISDTSGKIIACESYNANNLISFGSSLNIGITLFDKIYLKAFILLQKTLLDNKEYYNQPAFYATLKSYYEITAGRSILNLGFETGFAGTYNGERFIPQNRAYVISGINEKPASTGIDLFASARLGDAFARVTFRNILSQDYYYVPYYPEVRRSLRFSFSWSFFD